MTRHGVVRVASMLLLCSLASAAAGATTDAVQNFPDFTRLVQQYSDAVVSVTSEAAAEADGAGAADLMERLPIPKDSPFYEYFRRFFERNGEPDVPAPGRAAFGSGFIVDSHGFVITNAHVVKDAGTIRVGLSDRRELTATVVGADERSDIALLKIDAEDLPVARIGRSRNLQVGQWVLAIGAPFGLANTATQGIISALGRSLPGDSYTQFIQTDAAINPGNSGGPLFNLAGEVIGVNSLIYTGSGGYMGVSFAIPIDVAVDVADQLKRTGRVSRGWLGVTIQEVTADLARSFGLQSPRGALVADVSPDSPAAKGGLKTGDIIIGFNGQPIENVGELAPRVARVKPGTTAAVDIVRNGRERTLEVRIEELSDQAEPPPPKPKIGRTRLNLVVSDLPPGADGSGVLVEQVGAGAAARAGIEPGDVIVRIGEQAVANTAGFQAIVDKLPRGRPVPFLIRREGQSLFLPVTVPKGG